MGNSTICRLLSYAKVVGNHKFWAVFRISILRNSSCVVLSNSWEFDSRHSRRKKQGLRLFANTHTHKLTLTDSLCFELTFCEGHNLRPRRRAYAPATFDMYFHGQECQRRRTESVWPGTSTCLSKPQRACNSPTHRGQKP